MKQIMLFGIFILFIVFSGCVQQNRYVPEVTLGSSAPENYVLVEQSGNKPTSASLCADPKYVERTSTYILEGKITKVESAWNSENSLIYTYSDFDVESYLKGAPLKYGQIRMAIKGGCVDGICQIGGYSPAVKVGKTRLYLQDKGKLMLHVCGGIEALSTIECQYGQILHKGICKPKILDLTLNYNYSKIQKVGHGDGGIFDKILFDFNYSPLVSKAQELSRNKVNTYDKVYAISNYIYNSKIYRTDTNPPVDSIQSYWDMNNGKCFHAAQLTQAMLNDIGIPALHYDVYSAAHAETLVNIGGVWGVIDTTFHKANPTDLDINISLPALENMKNTTMYLTGDYMSMYDSSQNNFCNMDKSLCLREPFSMLRIMVNSRYPQQTLFVPLAYKFHTQTDLRRYYGCELVFPYNCTSGCVASTEKPTYNAKIGYPIAQATYPAFSWSGINSFFDYGDSDYVRQLIGYVKMSLPKNDLQYRYTCYRLDPSAWGSEPPANLHPVASYSFNMKQNSPVKITWNSLQWVPEGTYEEFKDVKTYLKSVTDDLGIFIPTKAAPNTPTPNAS